MEILLEVTGNRPGMCAYNLASNRGRERLTDLAGSGHSSVRDLALAGVLNLPILRNKGDYSGSFNNEFFNRIGQMRPLSR
jgi:hypothetical protein